MCVCVRALVRVCVLFCFMCIVVNFRSTCCVLFVMHSFEFTYIHCLVYFKSACVAIVNFMHNYLHVRAMFVISACAPVSCLSCEYGWHRVNPSHPPTCPWTASFFCTCVIRPAVSQLQLVLHGQTYCPSITDTLQPRLKVRSPDSVRVSD